MAKPTEKENANVVVDNEQATPKQVATRQKDPRIQQDLENMEAATGGLTREQSLTRKIMTKSPIVTALCYAWITIPLGVCALYFGKDGMNANYTLSSVEADIDENSLADNVPDSFTGSDSTFILPDYEDTYCYGVGRYLVVSGGAFLFLFFVGLINLKFLASAREAAFGPRGLQGISGGTKGILCCTDLLLSLLAVFSFGWWVYGMILIFGDYEAEQIFCEEVFDKKEMMLYAQAQVLLILCLFGGMCVLMCLFVFCAPIIAIALAAE